MQYVIIVNIDIINNTHSIITNKRNNHRNVSKIILIININKYSYTQSEEYNMVWLFRIVMLLILLFHIVYHNVDVSFSDLKCKCDYVLILVINNNSHKYKKQD